MSSKFSELSEFVERELEELVIEDATNFVAKGKVLLIKSAIRFCLQGT